MPDSFKYDVFLSYSLKDKDVVRELAERLKVDGLRVWFDEWEICPGDITEESIDDGLEASRVLVLTMSQHAVESELVTMESGTFRFRDPTNKERRFIPLRLDDTDVSNSLRQFAHIDWRDRDEKGYARLLAACRIQEVDRPSDKLGESIVIGKTISLGHTDSVISVALSGDGRRALSGALDNSVRAWDIESGFCLATMEGHTESVMGVVMNCDGSRALSGSVDKTMRFWDVENARCLVVMEGHTDNVLCVALSGDGSRAISGSRDKTVRVWDVENGRCLAVMEGHSAWILGVALSCDGRRGISGSADKTVRVWDMESGGCLAIMEGHTAKIMGVSLSGDGRIAISGDLNKTVRVWDVESGRCLVSLEGHTAEVMCVALSGDGRRALSGSKDKTVKVWDVESGRCLATLEGHTARVLGVALSNDGCLALSGSGDKTVRVWDVGRDICLATMKNNIENVLGVALSNDGRRALSGSDDNTVRLWDVEKGRCLATMEGHTDCVLCVALSGNSLRALSGSDDKTVRVWDVESGQCLAIMKGHTAEVMSVALSGDGGRALSGSRDKTVRVWDVENGCCLATLEGHTARVLGAALSNDGHLALSGAGDKTIRVWDVESGRCLASMEGHTAEVYSVALSGDGRRALSGSGDKTVRLWDVESGRCLASMEGHTAEVLCVALSGDGRRALSGSGDNTVRVWDVESGRCLAIMKGYSEKIWGVALSNDGRRALSGASNGVAQLWFIEPAEGLVVTSQLPATRYTNAKVLLVGDSGVGKTGLAYRLTEDRFVDTISSDGVETKRPDWATQLKINHENSSDGIEREIWLWDFAGQADYRLIHQLFMDETALAVLVFNPQSENPFEGLVQWDRDLIRAARRPFRKLLVAGRCDRGGLMVSNETIEHFRYEKDFAEYISTSALQDTGCDELRDAIIRHIAWEDVPWTASPHIFRILKEEIIKLKDEGKVLLRAVELKQQLEMCLPNESFTMEVLRAVVGLLAGPGIVWQLEFGDFILLHPERVNSYAAAVIRSVRSHTEEIGCIAEEKVLAGELDYQDMKRLPHDEEQVILRAMHQMFVDNGLCLREKTDHGHQLVFPSYFRRERPKLEEHPLALVTYRYNGSLDEIYATLVVRLHHSIIFEYDKLWRFAADFKTPSGKRLGLKMTKKNEGAAELEVYFEAGIADEVQVTFIRYVHEHLKQKAHDVVRVRHYVCPHCATSVEAHKAIEMRLAKGLKDIACVVCEKRVPLLDLIEEKFASEKFQRRVRELEEQATISIDNESRELILIGHAFAIAGEAGQIFRPTPNSDWGIDGEIEFKDNEGKASGRRLYLQLKSGDSYLYPRKTDGEEIFTIKNERHADYWQQQAYPVMLVIRNSDGTIRWMDVSEYLKQESDGGKKTVKQVVFNGEPFTAINLRRLRDSVLGASLYSQEETCQ